MLETAVHRIEGTIVLPPEAYRTRFSDQLNREDLQFIALRDAVRVPLDGKPATLHPFLLVARTAVLLAFQAGDDEDPIW